MKKDLALVSANMEFSTFDFNLTRLQILPFGPSNQFPKDVWSVNRISIIPRDQPRHEKSASIANQSRVS